MAGYQATATSLTIQAEQLIAYGSQRAEVNLGEILNTWIPIGGNDGGGSDESPL